MSKFVSAVAAGLALALVAASPARAADTLFEFFNTTLVHYFLTIDPAEAAAIDSGAAGPGWSRTGKTIAAYKTAASAPAGVAVVCRFYGNQAKGGPNSHFYTSEASECAAVKQDQGWTFERNEFFVIPAAGGASCPNGGVPVYRVYNGRFLEHDSNHRYMTSINDYNAMVALGWKPEGVVFCGAPADTPPVGGSGQCGNTMIEAGRTINYSQTDSNPFQRKLAAGTTTFNGQTALQVNDRDTATGEVQTTFVAETAASFAIIGTRTVQGADNQDTFYAPGLPVMKQWTLNQAVAYDIKILPQEPFAEEARQVGTITYLGTEAVIVPSGTYNACKLRIKSTTTGTQTAGVTTGTSDIWVFPGLGMVKQIATAALVIAGNTLPETTVIVQATSVQ